MLLPFLSFFFFFNDTATTEIYPLSLHDALPIYELFGSPLTAALLHEIAAGLGSDVPFFLHKGPALATGRGEQIDRKSTRLNSSHLVISYAVFCLKKKKKN